jgi:dTMP kinase
MVDFAVGDTRPNLTLLLSVPVEISEARRSARKETMLFDMPTPDKKHEGPPKLPFSEPLRDRMEEADRNFFKRVARGFKAIAAAEPDRVSVVDSSGPAEVTFQKIWELVQPVLPKAGRW